jgi:hypothetical protein
MAVFPDTILWAWERPEDLRALGPETGVAFLAQTIVIDCDRVDVRPRRQPLRVNPSTPLIAVTRIDHPVGNAPPDESVIPEIAAHVVRSRALPRVLGVQIDYDAVASERPFYRALLVAVRRELGRSTPLSITALASWCVGDRWLRGLPVDEAVPMLFRMGPANEPYRALAAGHTAARECGQAIGVSLDEPGPLQTRGRRAYVFNARSWTGAAIAEARRGRLE